MDFRDGEIFLGFGRVAGFVLVGVTELALTGGGGSLFILLRSTTASVVSTDGSMSKIFLPLGDLPKIE